MEITTTCHGGPLDGRSVNAASRWLEAMEEDGRIAQYERCAESYVLRGHFSVRYEMSGPVRDFVPLRDHKELAQRR